MAKKNVHSFLNEIKHIEAMRSISRTIYMNGAYSSSDLAHIEALGYDKRTIDDFIRRLNNYINTNKEEVFASHINPHRKQNKKAYFFHSDSLRRSSNFLSSLYFQHTISASDLFFYMYFTFGVACQRMEHTIFEEDSEIIDVSDFCISETTTEADIVDAMKSLYNYGIKKIATNVTEENFPLNKVYRYLQKFVDLGILLCKRTIRSGSDYKSVIKEYTLAPDILSVLLEKTSTTTSKQIMLQLQDLIAFFTNYTAVSIPGFFLQAKIDQLSKKIADECSDYSSPISFAETRFQNILDDNITWQLITAIDEMKPVKYWYQNTSKMSRNSNTDKKLKSSMTNTLLFPVKIIDDIRYGRHYLFGWKYKTNSISNGVHPVCSKKGMWICHRIDRITNLKIYAEKDDDYPQNIHQFIPKKYNSKTERKSFLNEQFGCYFKFAWNIDGSTKKKPKNVHIHFCFNNHKFANEYEKYLKATAGKGKLTCIDEEQKKYDYSVEVISTTEMIPWINSFGDTAHVDYKTNPEFYAELKNYNEEMLRIYESI